MLRGGGQGEVYQAQPVVLGMAPAEVRDQGVAPFCLLSQPGPGSFEENQAKAGCAANKESRVA